jgi:hypothetical protein
MQGAVGRGAAVAVRDARAHRAKVGAHLSSGCVAQRAELPARRAPPLLLCSLGQLPP